MAGPTEERLADKLAFALMIQVSGTPGVPTYDFLVRGLQITRPASLRIECDIIGAVANEADTYDVFELKVGVNPRKRRELADQIEARIAMGLFRRAWVVTDDNTRQQWKPAYGVLRVRANGPPGIGWTLDRSRLSCRQHK